MTLEKFQAIVENQCNYIKNSLSAKQDEYNHLEVDCLSSFKKAAQLENITPVQALEGYLTKHIISIYDMMNSNSKYSENKWNEKISDTISYLILLKGLLEDQELYL